MFQTKDLGFIMWVPCEGTILIGGTTQSKLYLGTKILTAASCSTRLEEREYADREIGHSSYLQASSNRGNERHTHQEELANNEVQDGDRPASGRWKSEAARYGEGPSLCRAMPHCWARRWAPVS